MLRIALGLWLLVTGCLIAQSSHAAPPNIVFLLADDQCKYSMGCYDAPEAKTPNLDALAARGVTFDRYYATTAICMASRATAMTGLYEYRTGCNFTTGPLTADKWSRSYPQLLRAAGYRTAFAGKFGFLVAESHDAKGNLPESDFDYWGGGPGQTHYETHRNQSMKKYADDYPHSTLSYAAFAEDAIADAAASDVPLCLSISFKAPHHPTTPDPQFDDVYRGVTVTKPANFGRTYGEHFSEQSRQGRQFDRHDSWHYSDQYDQVMTTYYQQIYAIDVAVGMIVQSLARHGIADNTVIIYTSDNGFMCGAHGYGSKVLPYEESSCVPMIIHDPRAALSSGKRSDVLSGNIDVAPTILEFAGVESPDGLDGKSLVGVVRDPSIEAHHESISLMNIWGPSTVHSFAVVTPQHKLIYWPSTKDNMKPTVELYDMQSDRLELTDLSSQSEHADTLARMSAIYRTALHHWTSGGVKHSGYPDFATQFAHTFQTE